MASFNAWGGMPLSPEEQFFSQLKAPPPAAAAGPAPLPLMASPAAPQRAAGLSLPTLAKLPKAAPQSLSPEIIAAMRALEQGGADNLLADQAGIASLKDRLQATMDKELPLDITPLAALTDQWSGSHLAQSYQVPETAAQRAQAVGKLQDQITSQEQGMGKDQMDGLRSKLSTAIGLDNTAEARGQNSIQNQAKVTDQNIQLAHLENEQQKLTAARLDAAKGKQLSEKDTFQIRKDLSASEPAKVVRGVTGLVGALNEYEKLFHDQGIDPTGPKARAMQTAYTNVTIKFKEAAQLGALSGPDMGLVNKEIADAGGFDTWFSAKTKGGKEGIQASINQIRKGSNQDFENAYANLKGISKDISAADPVLEDLQRSYTKAHSGAPKFRTRADIIKELEAAKSSGAK